MRTIVVLPTYNEKENLELFLPEFKAHFPETDILVVDDNSPDGSGDEVLAQGEKIPGIFLLRREKKEGLGPAYVAGFQKALAEDYDVIVQMDADFSHRFVDLKRLLAVVSHADFVVGARWVPGGDIKNWSLWRRFLSMGGNLYVQFLMGSRLHDWTGGFNVWKRHVLSRIPLERTQAQGYCFQVEMKWRALRLNFQPVEVPIVFEERRKGQSKMSAKIIFEALLQVCLLRFRNLS